MTNINFGKAWNELTNEEQWNYTETLFAERQKAGFDPLSQHFLEPKDQWECAHMNAKWTTEINARKELKEAKQKLAKIENVLTLEQKVAAAKAKNDEAAAKMEEAKARLAALKARVR